MTKKEQKGLKLISLLQYQEHYWTRTFMDEKGTTIQLGMIEKEHKGLILKVEGTLLGKIGTLMDEKGTKTFCKE